MPEPEQDSPLERMRKRLYAPGGGGSVQESALPASRPQAPEHWNVPPPPPARSRRKISGAALFLGFAVAFFLVAGAITAGVLFFGGRSVSTDNVDISVQGPTTVAGGEGVPISISVKNGNPVAITGASITLRFPDGTTDADDTSKPFPQYTDTLGDIPAGGSVSRTVRAAFFGSENQKVSIPITVDYRTGDSNADFVKKSQYEFTISTSPVGISVTSLSEVSSGQPLTLSVQVRSNASAPLTNVAVRAEYPFGFTQTSATPTPLSGNLFSLGTLAPGEEREIRVNGTLAGQDGETRVFHFTAGALKDADSREFGVSYTENDASVAIAKPFFDVALDLNRSEDPVVIAAAGDPIMALLSWTNALSSPIQNGSITVALAGDALDAGSVAATNGFYQSSNRSVVFDKSTSQGLGSLAPGGTGNGSFTFMTKTGSALAALRNPSIKVTVSVAGQRTGEAGVAENVNSTITRTIEIESSLSLSMRTARTIGGFSNTGPWPPVSDKESTYTVLLAAGNTVNTVANAVATMTLPSYVRFTGQTSGSAVAYNASTRQVTWTVGDMAPGAAPTAAFQVALLPSVSQKGTSPALTSDASLSGFDRFVQQQLTATAPAIDTQAGTDPAYQDSFGAVH